MAITRTAMVDDDGSGTTGTIINNAWKTELYNQIDAANAGLSATWTDVVFSAANYTANTGSWTVSAGNVVNHAYMVMGKTLWLTVVMSSTVVAGGPAALRIALPAGLTAARYSAAPINVFDAVAGSAVAYASVAAGTAVVAIQRDFLGTAWGNGATHVHGTILVNIV